MTNLWEISADTTIAPPQEFRCDFQPYGPFVMTDLSWGSYNGFPTLTGTVSKGTERSYLMGHTRDRDISGTKQTIYGVRQFEIEQGGCVRVAA